MSSGEASRGDMRGELASSPGLGPETRESIPVFPAAGDRTVPYPIVDLKVTNEGKVPLKIFQWHRRLKGHKRRQGATENFSNKMGCLGLRVDAHRILPLIAKD